MYCPFTYTTSFSQVLDGVGAGIYDTMIPIVVGRMTSGTGRFGFTYGFILTCWRIGHGFSFFAGELVVHNAGYSAAFVMEGALALMAMIILIAFVHVKE